MKKRNQLVGALLAGMLLGGGLTGTKIWAAPENNGDVALVRGESESGEETESQQDESDTVGDAVDTSSENTNEENQQSVDSETTGTESSETTIDESTDGDPSDNADQQQAAQNNVADDESQAAQAEQAAAAHVEADAAAQAQTEAEARQSAEQEAADAAANADAQAQQQSENKARAQAQQQSENQAVQNHAAGNETNQSARTTASAAGHTGGGSSQTSSSSGGGSASGRGASAGLVSAPAGTALTEAQKIENLRIGFQQVAKRYGIVNVGANRYLRIRDNKSSSANVVGTVNDGGLVFILVDDDADWYYVESGKVRGFVMKKWLTVGTEADKIVGEKGEAQLVRASATVDPTQNSAYRYSLNTVDVVNTTGVSASRQEIINYALTFVGGRYVWGGDDPHTGADCSGFVKYVYEHFGYTGLPRVSYEQCYAGTRIAASEAKPGDLLFYARDGVVYHVLMYIGNGKAVNAQSTATGIVVSDVNYDKVCWGVRLINDDYTSTQASSLLEDGKKASNGDANAQLKIIQALASAAQKASDEYGFPKSVLIAQAIQESGWLSFSGSADGGIQPEDNNILGMNASLLNDKWTSPWDGKAVDRNVPQSVNGKTVMGVESMRAYKDIESCLEDYAAFKIGLHPDLRGSKDVDKVISEGLAGYATDPNYQTSIKNIITKYNLTQYDVTSGYAVDSTSYTPEQLDLIEAVVAQEDDTTYDGALAVISTVMNRADQNYGGYGTNALSQLTADGQFAYSPKVSDPSLYQRRLNGNVPDFVKQAVSDCLTRGVRNHNFVSFRSTNSNGISTQIGSNWYFN